MSFTVGAGGTAPFTYRWQVSPPGSSGWSDLANNSTYGTRQSNKSTRGGGAIYGCRARTGTNACLRGSNLSNGRAFSFQTNSGTEVGRIDGPATAAPFTTSATGVATGPTARVFRVASPEAAVPVAAALPAFSVATDVAKPVSLFSNVSPGGTRRVDGSSE